MLPKGLADDATGLEAVVDPWISDLWKILSDFVEQIKDKEIKFLEKNKSSCSVLKMENNGILSDL